jgi:hypothetical protein
VVAQEGDGSTLLSRLVDMALDNRQCGSVVRNRTLTAR